MSRRGRWGGEGGEVAKLSRLGMETVWRLRDPMSQIVNALRRMFYFCPGRGVRCINQRLGHRRSLEEAGGDVWMNLNAFTPSNRRHLQPIATRSTTPHSVNGPTGRLRERRRPLIALAETRIRRVLQALYVLVQYTISTRCWCGERKIL